MNTNAIKGNKMPKKDKFKKLDSATYRSWGQRVHVDIDTKKKSTKQNKEIGETKKVNKYCRGELCMKKQQANRNAVDVKGEECKTCWAVEFDKLRLGKVKDDIRLPFEYSIAQKVAF